MKNAIIVFTKVPKEGDIKTRLTIKRGGILTKKEAKQFYEASLLDVIDACIASESGDLYICYNAKGNRDYLEELLGYVPNRHVIKDIFADKGGSFDQCMQYATDYILRDRDSDRLADSVIIVGGDLPTLQPTTIREAVNKMERLAANDYGQKAAKNTEKMGHLVGAAIVEGLCQEGGFSLFGCTCTTPFEFQGVFYNKDGITASDMLVNKASEQGVPFGIVEMVPDVDIPSDLASLISNINALKLAEQYDNAFFLPKRTIKVIQELGLAASALPSQR